jgi:hypothetical protein
MNNKTLGLALLVLATAGCGKYAAADTLGHGIDTRLEDHASQPKERNEHREDCRWKRPLFC